MQQAQHTFQLFSRDNYYKGAVFSKICQGLKTH